MKPRYRKNLNVLLLCFVVLGIMFGLVAYSPELYRAFCGATGYGGTTQRAYSDPTAASDETVTVAFDSNVAPDLPWRFEPEQRSVTVHLGEQKLVFFTAENLSNELIVGHATFNVTPETSGIYFNKIQCFCFNEERLDPHQKVDMPVVFFVDPSFAKDLTTCTSIRSRSAIRFFARRIRHKARIFRVSWPMQRRIPSTANNSSPNAALLVTRWTATRPVQCLAGWSAAEPARRPDTTIRPR